MKLSDYLTKFLNLGVALNDNESIQLNKRFLTYMALLMSGGGLMWGGICLKYDIFKPAIIPLSYSFLTCFNLFYFYITKNFNKVRFIQVLMSMLLPFMFQISLGGFIESGGVMLWAFLALVASMTFQNLKQSGVWMLLYLFLTFLVSYFDSNFIIFAIKASHKVQTLFLSINIGVISSVIFGLFVYFVTSRNNANETLQRMNLDLEKTILERTSEIVLTNAKLGESNEELTALISQLEDKNHQIIDKNKHITDSVNYAHRIQTAILMDSSIQCVDPLNYFILLKPKDIVSGDFYWFHCLPLENKMVVAVVDCTGHGVPGAFMSLIGDSLLNQIIIEHHIIDPAEILKQMDLGVTSLLRQEHSKNRDGMDMSIVVFDMETGQFEFAGANSSIVLISDGKLNQIKGTFFPVGGVSTVEKIFTKQNLIVKKDDLIYFYSDGYADQFGGNNDRKFLVNNFRKLLLSINNLPLEHQKNRLEEEHLKWKGERKQTDDILVIGMKIDFQKK